MDLINKFERLAEVRDIKTPTRAPSIENISAVAVSLAENPGLFIPRRLQELGISQTSLYRILHKNHSLQAYKVQIKA